MGSNCSTSQVCDLNYQHHDSFLAKASIAGARTHCLDIEHFHDMLFYISQKNWIYRENSFLDSGKFFACYKEYLRDQTFVSEVWEGAHAENEEENFSPKRIPKEAALPRLKLLIRTGIPLDKLREVILEIFRKKYSSTSLEYEGALKVAFSENVPETFKNVPLFSYSNNIEDVLPVHFLNKKGLEAFKRILWVYEKNVLHLEYSPFLSQVVAALLMFLNEDEAYCVVKEMLEHSKTLIESQNPLDGLKSLKWYFTFTKEEFELFMESVCRYIKDQINEFPLLWKHFFRIQCDCYDLMWQILRTFFLEFLPLSLCLKIFEAYLNEGIKIYYRFSLAFLKIFEEDLVLCSNTEEVISFLKSKREGITKLEIQTLMSTAYSLNFSELKRKFPDLSPDNFHVQASPRIYLPQFTSFPCTTDTKHFETVWEWIPENLKLATPTLAYSSKVHGWSLNTLYSKCRKVGSYQAIILLIKTIDNVTFGAFVDGKVKMHELVPVSEGTDESFVFQLEPEERKYKATKKKNSVHLVCQKESLAIGAGSQGAAIFLSENLLYGYSYKSETYDNLPLNLKGGNPANSQFECSALELYLID